MKALRLLQTLANNSSRTPLKPHKNPTFLSRFYTSQPLQQNPVPEPEETHTANGNSNNGIGFDSSYYELPTIDTGKREATWDEKYRRRADKAVFKEEYDQVVKDKKYKKKGKTKNERLVEQEEKRRRSEILSRALLEVAVAETDEDEEDEEEEREVVKVEDQLSLSVGIIGAPNAGKSALTNFMGA
ncbi:putative P-loop containing nucleoside triphosphate hydrolase [Helianthus annuus]|nr:putative P-loop containing nucleoside triphosphate hydrolase [Helianthus annuus]